MKTFTIKITCDTRMKHEAFTALVNRILAFFQTSGKVTVNSCEIDSVQSRD